MVDPGVTSCLESCHCWNSFHATFWGAGWGGVDAWPSLLELHPSHHFSG